MAFPQVLLDGYLGLSHNYPDLMCLFAVNFHAFDFELEEIALFQGCLWLKIKGMKIDSKKTQKIQIIMGQFLTLEYQHCFIKARLGLKNRKSNVA